jgi:chorismate mutase/prephenate dehydratase
MQTLTDKLNLRVGYLGPDGTYSHAMARECFADAERFVACASIPLVFRRVANDELDAGVVPIENTIEGGVAATLDAFMAEPRCRIVGERMMRIEHGLHAHPDTLGLASLRRVYSHPQALAQCRDWLARELPGADVVACASTAEAARWVADDPGTAAIGGASLARRYGLKTVAHAIQDAPFNVTRFLIVALHETLPTGNDRTSVMVELSHEPGALYEGLGFFAKEGVNLTHIESRPIPSQPFEYRFFLELSGHCRDEPVARALDALRLAHPHVAVLGSYPRAATEL